MVQVDKVTLFSGYVIFVLSSYCTALLPDHCCLATSTKSPCFCVMSRGHLHNYVAFLMLFAYKGKSIMCVQHTICSSFKKRQVICFPLSYIICCWKVWTKIWFSVASKFYILQEGVSASCKQEFCSGLAHKNATGISSPSRIWMPRTHPWHSLRGFAQKDICVALLSCHNECLCANKINEWTFLPCMGFSLWNLTFYLLILCVDY